MADQGHKDGEASLLADERISWKVPVLLNNDWIALRLAKALNPQLPKPLFESVYGCPPCAWAGGRPSKVRRTLEESELRRYFEAYAEVGASCALTLSRPDAGEELHDPYCNMLLQLLDEYHGQAIVVDERLARHIRSTHPDIKLVASNNRVFLDYNSGFLGLSEERYYRQLLELYDVVVVRSEALLAGGIAEDLVDIASRVELIVNQRCIPNCPVASWHIQAGAEVVKDRLAGGDAVWPHCKYPDRTETIVVPAERRGELVQMGFCDFKLQGRNRKPHHVVAYLVDSILSKQGIEALKDTLRPIMQEAFFLGLFDASVDALISIPKGSCPPPTLSDGSAS